MKYIVRIKCVSQCMNIRRSYLCYATLENKKYNLVEFSHPLSSFLEIEIKDGNLIWNNNVEKLLIGDDVYLYNNRNVTSLNKIETEIIVLGAMIIPIDVEMEDYYISCINDNLCFDEWNGEFEYLLGLMYELCLNDHDEAYKWYQKAIDKGFYFKLM